MGWNNQKKHLALLLLIFQLKICFIGAAIDLRHYQISEYWWYSLKVVAKNAKLFLLWFGSIQFTLQFHPNCLHFFQSIPTILVSHQSTKVIFITFIDLANLLIGSLNPFYWNLFQIKFKDNFFLYNISHIKSFQGSFLTFHLAFFIETILIRILSRKNRISVLYSLTTSLLH